MKKFLTLIVSIAIAQTAGLIGSFFTRPNIDTWYATLSKPSWNPPNWVFAPVWITLFALMGIAAYFVWQQHKNQRVTLALSFYLDQLFLNVLWSYIFFALHSPAWAFAEILVLQFFILLTTVSFLKIDKKAAVLLAPYLLWVAFAALLNYNIWQLNLMNITS